MVETSPDKENNLLKPTKNTSFFTAHIKESAQFLTQTTSALKENHGINLLNDLSTNRVRSCSFYPYTVDENSNISLLFRCKKMDSKKSWLYTDFGTTLRDNEPNILFSAARSFVSKSAGLCLPSELVNLPHPAEIKRIVKETVNKGTPDIFTS